MHYYRSGWEKPVKLTLICTLFVVLTISSLSPAAAQVLRADTHSLGDPLVVTNLSEEMNGSLANPAALIADPGPDGISLPEAIAAANNTSAYTAIIFEPLLSGATLSLTHDLPHITQDNLTISGDINEDGIPDITINGSNADFNCFNIVGASNVVIRGFIMQNFPKHGVYVRPNSGNSRPDVDNIVIYQNEITAAESAISLMISGQTESSISNVEINSNTIYDGTGAISIIAGMGENANNNLITGIKILDNTIDNSAPSNDIFISPAADIGLSGNTVSDIEIRGNHITGQNDSSIIVDASNQTICSNNTLSGLLITDNTIEGIAVGIELVGESGSSSTGNLMTDVTISDNTLIGCGIHVAGSTGYNAHGNTISNLTFERNYLNAAGVSGSANGIYLAAGADGAYGNLLEDLIIRDNFINGFRDAGILLHGNDASSPNNTINRVTILNQTITNNAIGNSWAAGIHVNTRNSSNTITNVTIKNSILWGNGGDDAIKGSITPEVVTNTILNDVRFTGNDGNFYNDPAFAAPSTGDYHLQSTSPGIDTGDPTAASVGLEDLDHRGRVADGNGDTTAVIDLGAWEYGGPAMPEIAILGNSQAIFNNDQIPATWDGTQFGIAEIGAGSVQSTFTIENTSGSPLALNGTLPVELTGANAADFSITSQPAATINGEQSSTFTIAFTPTAAGPRDATVQILNNDSDEAVFTFALQGIGAEPPAPQEIAVSGDGQDISSEDDSPSTLDGTDFGNAVIGGDAIQHTFSIQNTGDNTLELTGTYPVEITGAQAGDFTVTSQAAASILGGQSSTFTIEFAPVGSGLREATIQILNNDSDEGTFTFAIQGLGEEPLTEPEIGLLGNGEAISSEDGSPSTVDGTDFGNAVIGGAAVQHTFTIQNTGENTLELTGVHPVEITGAQAGDFTVTSQAAASISGGQSSTFTIEFAPAGSGLRKATVEIANNDSDEGLFTFTVQGTGEEPPAEQEIVVSGKGLSIPDSDNTPSTEDGTNFGDAEVGGAAVQSTFTIQNIGESPLELTGTPLIVISGAHASDFVVTGEPDTSITGGSSTTFTIEFVPTGTGHREATVHIPNNDADEGGFNFVIVGNGTESAAEEFNNYIPFFTLSSR